MTQQENTCPLRHVPSFTLPDSGGSVDLTRPPELVLPALCFPRRLPPPGHTALTFLPSHDLDSFPSSPEINRSLAAPGSPTLNLAPRQPSGGGGLAGTGSSPPRPERFTPEAQVCPSGPGSCVILAALLAGMPCPLALVVQALPFKCPSRGASSLPRPRAPCCQVSGGPQCLPVEPVTALSLFAGAPSPIQTVCLLRRRPVSTWNLFN